MKKGILFLAACVLGLNALAYSSSTPDEKYYTKEKSRRVKVTKNSETFYYKSGSPMRETTGDCSKECTVKSYYENGTVQSMYKVKKNQKEGDATYYDSNGSSCRKLKYSHGRRVGKEEIFDSEGNVLVHIEYNAKGLYNGRMVEYFQKAQESENRRNGNALVRKHEVTYKDGKKNGAEVWYHADGSIANKVMYKNGKKHGTEIWNYPSGRIHSIVEYKDGEPSENRDGDQKVCYNENGSIAKVGLWSMGCGEGKKGPIQKPRKKRSGNDKLCYDEDVHPYKGEYYSIGGFSF